MHSQKLGFRTVYRSLLSDCSVLVALVKCLSIPAFNYYRISYKLN
jgi:hypothetical protein